MIYLCVSYDLDIPGISKLYEPDGHTQIYNFWGLQMIFIAIISIFAIILIIVILQDGWIRLAPGLCISLTTGSPFSMSSLFKVF